MRMATDKRSLLVLLVLAAVLALSGCAAAGPGAFLEPLPTTAPGLWRPTPVAPVAAPSATPPTASAARTTPRPTAPPAALPTVEPGLPGVIVTATLPPTAPPTALNPYAGVASATAPTLAAPTSAAPASPNQPAAAGLDVAALQQLLLELVNKDRQANGLGPVTWDPVAAQAGMAHAAELAPLGVLSHWNQAGYGPDLRYSLAGGPDSVMENGYMYWHSPGGGPRTAQAWTVLVTEAEANLMQSPGHRANILTPEHTGLGIGLAYDAAAGSVELTQEFTNHYVTMAPTQPEARVGEQITVRGRLEAGASAPLINLAWEPLPQAMTVAALKQTSSYSSPAQFYQALSPTVGATGEFEQAFTLDYQGQAGVYHVRVWVDTSQGQVLAVDRVVFVR